MKLYKIFYLFIYFVGCNFLLQAQQKKTIKATKTVDPVFLTSYELFENGDTINKLTSKNERIGKWVTTKEAKYGEEGMLEYGYYDKNNKVGVWKTYTLSGQILSIENFKSGRKDGEAKYFDNGLLYCVGNYLALNAKKEFDTIMVEDPITNVSKPVKIKTNVGSVRHGFWTYYFTGSNKIEKVVEYQLDEVVYEKDYLTKLDSTYIEKKIKSLPHVSNKQPSEVWHFEKNKKPVKYTDIPENTKSVVPNVRKK